MSKAVIAGYVRSPFHFAAKGALTKVRPDDLAATVIKGLLAKTGVKPDDIRAKIVEGKLNKQFLAQSVLLEQPWIFDTGKTVEKALAESGTEVVEFRRFALSE